MDLRYVNIAFLAGTLALLSACHEKREYDVTYYSAANSRAFVAHVNALAAIHTDSVSLANSIFLIVQETQCSSCLSELQWWEENQQEIKGARIYVMVTTKYMSVGQLFLKEQGITLPALFDTSEALLAQHIIPDVPVKVYLNQELEIKTIQSMRAGLELDDFLETVNE
ncbi:MAG: hypothetical protein AAFW89_15335 [Bacteroidota bacterium]